MRDLLRLLALGLALLGAAQATPVGPAPPPSSDPAPSPAPTATPAPAPDPAGEAAPGSSADRALRNDLDLADALANALATALQTVYDRYVVSAISIPDDVREQLEAEYGSELAEARFVVSPAAVRLLGTIDRFQGTAFGKGMHALTIDDLILLASDPAKSESPYTLWIWAHELHHVRQYRERGSILAFARDYLRDCEALEQEADARANRALGMDVKVRHCLQ